MRLIATVTILAAVIVLFICTNSSSVVSFIRFLADIPPEVHDPHIAKHMLTLELKASDTKVDPPTIIATVTNLHASTTITLLTWDTPFDEDALLSGIFIITDLDNGHEVPSPKRKLDRAEAPPKEAFLEVGPRSAIAKEIVLEGTGAQLEAGMQYEVSTKGRWKAVWHASVAHIGDINLRKMGGGNGVVAFDFESNAITVKG